MDNKTMNSDIYQFMQKIQAIIETKSANETRDFLLSQILSLANKLSQFESDYEKMKLALEAKDDLIEQYQSVIKESTNKFNQLELYNVKLMKDKQRRDSETDTLLISLSDIRDEIEEIESNYNGVINEKVSQISFMTEQINSIVLEKNELIRTINDYHVVSEKEKEELTMKIDRLIKEIEYIKCRRTENEEEMSHNLNSYKY